jgi:hypothetical protein
VKIGLHVAKLRPAQLVATTMQKQAAGAANVTPRPSPRFKVGDRVQVTVAHGYGIKPGDVGVIESKGILAGEYWVRVGTPPQAVLAGFRDSELEPETLAVDPHAKTYLISNQDGSFTIDWAEIDRRALTSSADDEERARRKAAGCCETCGTLRPMSSWGLLPCPQCPEPPVKQ